MLLDNGDAKTLGGAFIIVCFHCDPHGRSGATAANCIESKSALAEQSVSAAVSPNWEDEMRRQGVKRARIRVGVRRPNGAMEATIVRVVYYSEYDTNCSEIRDHDKLLKIRASGLEEALGDYAIGETAMSKVVGSESWLKYPTVY
jgi:hypothetical protein